MRKGKLYGVGVGPGDPDLLTLKAYRILSECRNIAYPGENPKENMACSIAEKAIDGFSEKNLIACSIPMTRDKAILEDCYNNIVSKISEVLETGDDVAYITIGEPTIYSTYMYIHERVYRLGYDVEIVNGISSFTAAAAALGISLSEHEDELHIIPASTKVERIRALNGNLVFMKPGKENNELRDYLHEAEQDGCKIYAITDCGLPTEKKAFSAREIPESIPYMTTIFMVRTDT